MKKLEIIDLCGVCPEDYEIFINGVKSAYCRLRHGNFNVYCPDYNGENVYSAQPNGDGIFDPDERDFYLTVAKYKAIVWYDSNYGKILDN